MKKSSNFSEFTNLYSLSKTLRFELVPERETLQHIEAKGLLNQDEERAEEYKKIKKIIDDYHKIFIQESLQNVHLKNLQNYEEQYNISNKTDQQKKDFKAIQQKLRKEIVEKFKENSNYKNLFAKELIKETLLNFVQANDTKLLLERFKTFTTYFTGFHENRKNMYSDKDLSTAIAFRLIHQNLPKFIDNKKSFEKIKNSTIQLNFSNILNDFEPITKINQLEDVFELNNFNENLTQQGIETYNQLIGGFTSADKKQKIKGLNEYINLYNQNVKDKKDRLPKLKILFKQILSEKNTISWLPEKFKHDQELLESIENFYQDLNQAVLNIKHDKFITLPELFQQLKNFELNKIYIKNDVGLTNIAKNMFGDWSVFENAIQKKYEIDNPYTSKEPTKKWLENKEKSYKSPDSFSIQYLNDCLTCLENTDKINYHQNIADYFINFQKSDNQKDLIAIIHANYQMVMDILNAYDKSNLSNDEVSIDKIKIFLDSIKNLQRFIKPLLGHGNEAEKDNVFYTDFEKNLFQINQINKLYDKVRNYITKKPYSTEKIKLNFENSTLLNGWDVNKESDNTSVLFIKENIYYLGIMNVQHNKVFKKIPASKSTHYYQKINYKLLPKASQNLPRILFSDKNIQFFNPSEDILRIRNGGSHTKNGETQKGFEKQEFNLNDCHTIIDFFKDSLQKHEEWKYFNFSFSPTNSYHSIDEFYREVENQGYKISYTNIDENYINQLVQEGKLFLFKIYNKDFSNYSKGTPNMHTLYWKMLFDETNLNDVVYQLNGNAEVFYRKLSIPKMITHKANSKIDNKNNLNAKKQSTFHYDLIKDKRFSENKFQFHVPITINFKANDKENVNAKVKEFIFNNGVEHIIGIDRGERHLLYLVLIDLEGNIVKQFSLNEIMNEYNGQKYNTNYHDLLKTKEILREEARKNWKNIENIKELKEGYLSLVIHKICQLMIEYKAIVALEDLNMGFMRGRQKVEKQVYQKFEKMLIDKLNYFVDKKKTVHEEGGLLKALQLTSKFESFEKLGKQSGFLFYIPAWNTSKIDPMTGFVSFFNTQYETIKNSQEFFNKFESICFNRNKNYFEFVVSNYKNFNPKAAETKQEWVICTNGSRLENFRNKNKNSEWDTREVNLTADLIKLCTENNIKFEDSICLKEQISQQDKANFFKSLFHLFKLTVQMRNSKSGTDEDFMVSPIYPFFDSRNAKPELPENADANGAFNIARKGLMLINKIKVADLSSKKIDLAISNKEWLNFAQEK